MYMFFSHQFASFQYTTHAKLRLLFLPRYQDDVSQELDAIKLLQAILSVFPRSKACKSDSCVVPLKQEVRTILSLLLLVLCFRYIACILFVFLRFRILLLSLEEHQLTYPRLYSPYPDLASLHVTINRLTL